MKICDEKCKYSQKYNEDWAICWHRLIKGSKVQLNKYCIVDLIKTSPSEPQKLKIKK